MVGWPFENDVYPDGYLLAGEEAERALQLDTHVRGLRSWGYQRGPSVTHYRGPYPHAADNVLLPDGSRGKIRAIDIASVPATWRRPLNDPGGRWLATPSMSPFYGVGERLLSWTTILYSKLLWSRTATRSAHTQSRWSGIFWQISEIQKFVMDPLAAHATLWMIVRATGSIPNEKSKHLSRMAMPRILSAVCGHWEKIFAIGSSTVCSTSVTFLTILNQPESTFSD